jgi:hypothetical protein
LIEYLIIYLKIKIYLDQFNGNSFLILLIYKILKNNFNINIIIYCIYIFYFENYLYYKKFDPFNSSIRNNIHTYIKESKKSMNLDYDQFHIKFYHFRWLF